MPLSPLTATATVTSYLWLQVGHVLGEVDEALDGGQDDARVGGAQDGVEVVEQADGLILVNRVVAAHQAQHLGGRQGRGRPSDVQHTPLDAGSDKMEQ